MVRINSKAINKQARRLTHELECLFGSEITDKADNIDASSIELSGEQVERIDQTVDELLSNTSHPLKQQRIVSTMNDQDKLVLYLWLSDLNIFANHHAGY